MNLLPMHHGITSGSVLAATFWSFVASCVIAVMPADADEIVVYLSAFGKGGSVAQSVDSGIISCIAKHVMREQHAMSVLIPDSTMPFDALSSMSFLTKDEFWKLFGLQERSRHDFITRNRFPSAILSDAVANGRRCVILSRDVHESVSYQLSRRGCDKPICSTCTLDVSVPVLTGDDRAIVFAMGSLWGDNVAILQLTKIREEWQILDIQVLVVRE